MNRVALIAFATLVPLGIVGATSIASGGSGTSDLSMQITVDERKADGKDWDWRPQFGLNADSGYAGLEGLASRYPDLVLTVISEDGSVQELVNAPDASGNQDSFCEDRLTCSWTVSAPGAYYAVIATDLDTGVSPQGVLDTIKSLLTGEGGEKPLVATSEFAGAVIVTSGWFGADEDRVAALEAKIHEYLEGKGAPMRSSDAIGVLQAGDCEEACTLDESGTVRLTIG